MILADKIIDLRKKNGWSQEELAEKLGVSRQAVSKWESAQAIPDLGRVLAMADLFSVTTDYLLRDENEAPTPAAVEDGASESSVRRVSMEEASAFLALCRELKARTDEDLQRGVIARFHDESQLNRLVAEAPQHFRILPPDYCTPEETPTGHEAILVLQKSRFIQIDASRTVKKPQSFPARKWEAFCLNYLWRARDTLLRRRVEPPKH